MSSGTVPGIAKNFRYCKIKVHYEQKFVKLCKAHNVIIDTCILQTTKSPPGHNWLCSQEQKTIEMGKRIKTELEKHNPSQ